MEYLGTETGGRWFPTEEIREGMVLFSFGVGEDISFELELLSRGVEVYCFDPTPKSKIYIEALNEPRIHFYPVGLWIKDMDVNFYYPERDEWVSCSITNMRSKDYFVGTVKTLRTIIDELEIAPDILKLDIEGAEYRVIDKMKTFPPILMVEFHDNEEHGMYVQWIGANYENCFNSNKDYLFL